MKIDVLGVKIDDLTYDEAVGEVNSFWNIGKHYVVTPNPEMVMYATQHPDHKIVLNRADMSIADGIGIVWASIMLGRPLKGRVTGTDLAEKLIGEAAKRGETVFFLGGRNNAAEESAKKFLKHFKGLRVAGWAEGDASEKGDDEIRCLIGNKQIGLLLVAYGHPGQEYWISRNIQYLNVKVAMGIGGAFDFWSGKAIRAPLWVRKIGLEWLYRLVRDPRRFSRQLALPAFVIRILWRVWSSE
jgi:N-acetylglucosaminyldiphosphoundecaprenol N-acetyl-beta-D-mannosaminyltransferase